MDVDEFWRLIGIAKEAAADYDGRPLTLTTLLSERSAADVQDFYEHYIDHIDKAWRWDLWGAAYFIQGGCSDDGFDYFRDWLISEGREVYEAALVDPESLGDVGGVEDAGLEEFRYVADKVYEAKTGKEMVPRERHFPRDLVGEEWDEDDLETMFPKLAARFD
ncbi:MAG: DUF4240 domain-containing protein [Woeseiaceae bacterium]|nr:DUF4240 domain-containing protein [Woeseiaceae bacterium]